MKFEQSGSNLKIAKEFNNVIHERSFEIELDQVSLFFTHNKNRIHLNTL